MIERAVPSWPTMRRGDILLAARRRGAQWAVLAATCAYLLLMSGQGAWSYPERDAGSDGHEIGTLLGRLGLVFAVAWLAAPIGWRGARFAALANATLALCLILFFTPEMMAASLGLSDWSSSLLGGVRQGREPDEVTWRGGLAFWSAVVGLAGCAIPVGREAWERGKGEGIALTMACLGLALAIEVAAAIVLRPDAAAATLLLMALVVVLALGQVVSWRDANLPDDRR